MKMSFLEKKSRNLWKMSLNSEEKLKLKQKTQGFGKSTWSTCRKRKKKLYYQDLALYFASILELKI